MIKQNNKKITNDYESRVHDLLLEIDSYQGALE